MKTFLVYNEIRKTALTYVERDGRLFMLHPYEFSCECTDGTWLSAHVWCDQYEDVLDEARFNAGLLGTGKYRIYGNVHKHEMWRDEHGTLHVTKKCWSEYGNDFKGRYSDAYGEHPELKGKRELMPPLELGYSTCLLIEGSNLIIEKSRSTAGSSSRNWTSLTCTSRMSRATTATSTSTSTTSRAVTCGRT